VRGIEGAGLQPAHTWQCTQSKRIGRRGKKRKAKVEAGSLTKNESHLVESMEELCRIRKQIAYIKYIYSSFVNLSVFFVFRPVAVCLAPVKMVFQTRLKNDLVVSLS